MIPVPGFTQGTPYGQRGSYWSCDEDSHGNGIHTGVDYPAPTGTKVVAARGGTAVYCNHGSAFGNHQIEVRCDDGTRDFYAHMIKRSVDSGTHIKAGAKIGEVGAEGNVTGPHLHFERHACHTCGWSCSVVRDPKPSINYQPGGSEDDVTDDDIKQIARRVVLAMGDYNADGSVQDKYKDEPAEGDNRLRSIANRLDKIENQLDKLVGK